MYVPFLFIDPRFDGLSGKFNYDLYRKSYKFIEEKQEEELKEMKEQMYQEENDKEKRAIQVRMGHLFHIGRYDTNYAAEIEQRSTRSCMPFSILLIGSSNWSGSGNS